MVIKLNTKRRLKINEKNLLLCIITLISLFGLGFSIYGIIKYKINEKRINSQLDVIEDNVTFTEVDEVDNVEIIEQVEDILKNNPYWKYINMNLIDVDFTDLKSINNDVKGWIQVNGTNINYPFVQVNDNQYYLNHAFDKSWNSAGWVFLDYRNILSDFNDKNTILYAHGMKNKSMFGTLRNILTSGWLNDTNNHVVKLSTEYENTLWQVFSVYRIPNTSDYIQTDFTNDEEFNTFTNMLVNRSSYNFNVPVSSSDRILTLSTCYNNSDKVVLHAKLIKREVK